MKTTHTKKLLICLTLLSLFIITPLSSAKLRSNYLIDFISNNRISESEGFTNAIEFSGSISYEATYYALDMLSDFNQMNIHVDPVLLAENLGKAIYYLFEYQTIDLHDLYYLLSSLNILGQIDDIITSNSSLNGKIIDYINQTAQITGGFTMKNTTSTPTVISTFYGIKNYELINEILDNELIHVNWLLTCNNSDGGFGGNSTSISDLSPTYYAALALDNLNSYDNLTSTNKDNITQYAKDFYLSNGGYRPDLALTQTVIWSTYYSIKLISMIPNPEYNDRDSTINWILDRQNILDGGFSDPSAESGVQNSSITSSYNAYRILSVLNALGSLNNEIGIVEFNWVILLAILVVIGVVVGLLFFLWKRRQI